jgi:hypothetical protein
MITVGSPHETALTKAAQRRVWDAFLSSGTNHSASAATLPYIIRRCELEQIPYILNAVPGMGYYIKRAET